MGVPRGLSQGESVEGGAEPGAGAFAAMPGAWQEEWAAEKGRGATLEPPWTRCPPGTAGQPGLWMPSRPSERGARFCASCPWAGTQGSPNILNLEVTKAREPRHGDTSGLQLVPPGKQRLTSTLSEGKSGKSWVQTQMEPPPSPPPTPTSAPSGVASPEQRRQRRRQDLEHSLISHKAGI